MVRQDEAQYYEILKGRCALISDSNECYTGNGYCSQACINTLGSYKCSCLSGYVLNMDNRSCDGKNSTYLSSI